MNGYSPTIAQEVLQEIEAIETMESYCKKFDSFMEFFCESLCASTEENEDLDSIDTEIMEKWKIKKNRSSLSVVFPRKANGGRITRK